MLFLPRFPSQDQQNGGLGVFKAAQRPVWVKAVASPGRASLNVAKLEQKRFLFCQIGSKTCFFSFWDKTPADSLHGKQRPCLKTFSLYRGTGGLVVW